MKEATRQVSLNILHVIVLVAAVLTATAGNLAAQTASGSTIRQRLFGSIVERDGHYKFVTLANEL